MPDTLEQLPLHLQPLPGEALASWFARLAQRFDVSVATLAREGLDVRDTLRADWWARPDERLLALLERRTGVGKDRLRAMTLLDWAPVVRDDEASGRFDGWRHQALPPGQRVRGLAVCPQCLREDSQPYIRKEWLIGWVAACPVHRRTLLIQCPRCRLYLRVPPPGRKRPESVSRCASCRFDLSRRPTRRAPLSALRLQSAFLAAKQFGQTDVPGLGRISWAELLTLCDVLLCAFWVDMTPDERAPLLYTVGRSPGIHRSLRISYYRGRLGGLLLLGWLLDGWPQRSGPDIVFAFARQWLAAADQRKGCLGPSAEEVSQCRLLASLWVAGSSEQAKKSSAAELSRSE